MNGNAGPYSQPATFFDCLLTLLRCLNEVDVLIRIILSHLLSSESSYSHQHCAEDTEPQSCSNKCYRVFLFFAMSAASLLLNFSASGPIPPWVDRTSGVKVAFSTSMMRCVDYTPYFFILVFLKSCLHCSQLVGLCAMMKKYGRQRILCPNYSKHSLQKHLVWPLELCWLTWVWIILLIRAIVLAFSEHQNIPLLAF